MKVEPDFYPLQMASEKCHRNPDSIINDWLDHKIPLYIRLDALPCRIVRYLSGGDFLLKNWQRKIKSGMDYYQHERMSEFKTRQFYPIKDTEIDACLIGGDLELCRFSYDGIAHGYWRVKATSVTHFSDGHYILADMDTVNECNNIPGAIAVYGRDDWDYLIFKSEIYRNKLEFFFDANMFLPKSEMILSEEKKEKKERISRPERIALYVMLKKHYCDNAGNINFCKMAEMLTLDAKGYGFSKKFSDDTIAEWIKRFDGKN